MSLGLFVLLVSQQPQPEASARGWSAYGGGPPLAEKLSKLYRPPRRGRPF